MDAIQIERIAILLNIIAGFLLSLQFIIKSEKISLKEKYIRNIILALPLIGKEFELYYPWEKQNFIHILYYFLFIILLFSLIVLSFYKINGIYSELSSLLMNYDSFYIKIQDLDQRIEIVRDYIDRMNLEIY